MGLDDFIFATKSDIGRIGQESSNAFIDLLTAPMKLPEQIGKLFTTGQEAPANGNGNGNGMPFPPPPMFPAPPQGEGGFPRPPTPEEFFAAFGPKTGNGNGGNGGNGGSTIVNNGATPTNGNGIGQEAFYAGEEATYGSV